jgi:hypothetical protein
MLIELLIFTYTRRKQKKKVEGEQLFIQFYYRRGSKCFIIVPAVGGSVFHSTDSEMVSGNLLISVIVIR